MYSTSGFITIIHRIKILLKGVHLSTKFNLGNSLYTDPMFNSWHYLLLGA